MASKLRFSQKHPFLFGFSMIVAAVALIIGAMAVFTLVRTGGPLFAGGRIGVVRVEGTIAGSERVNDWIQRMQRDESIRGVVVRIDSPGGGVAASQEIFRAVRRLAETKPVVASMGSVAASGGYYVACGADEIVANPGSITGSIGVKAQLPNVRELMDKMGVKQRTIVSGEFKDAGSPTEPLSREERRYFQALVDDLFEQFVRDVASGRGMEPGTVRSLADGRAYTGSQAKKLGLVDELGGMHAAVQQVKEMTGLTGSVPLVSGPEERFSLLDWVLGSVRLDSVRQELAGSEWMFRY
jgi:protease-4